jgi:phosphatidylglycerol:prolipoprotein diacylglycerol transferase
MTLLQIQFPDISPVFLRLGPVQLRWYGLMYMISFIIGYFLLKRYAKTKGMGLSGDDIYDLLFFLILGVMIGGRLGYVLFYDLGSYLEAPLQIVYIWLGGMSFHGGFLGVVAAVLFLCRRRNWSFAETADLVCAAAPVGLGLVRLGNFINGELFGRPTTLAWGVIFPEGGPVPRHPSQIYEALLEGLVLFLILRWLFRKNLYPGTVSWAMVGLYGLFRFAVEFVREPDAHIGFDLGPFTRGQLLTFPMMAAGLIMLVIYARRRLPAKSRSSNTSRAR